MMDAEASQPAVEKTKARNEASPPNASTRAVKLKEDDENKLKHSPPTIITVETSQPKRSDTESNPAESAKRDKSAAPAERRDAEDRSFRQARTPKHANKTMTSGGGMRDDPSPPHEKNKAANPNTKITPDRPETGAASFPPQEKLAYSRQQPGAPPAGYYPPGDNYPPRPYEPQYHSNPPAGGTSFAPHDSRRESHHVSFYAGRGPLPPGPAQAVSPGGTGGGEYPPYYEGHEYHHRNAPPSNSAYGQGRYPESRGPPPPGYTHRQGEYSGHFEQGGYRSHAGHYGQIGSGHHGQYNNYPPYSRGAGYQPEHGPGYEPSSTGHPPYAHGRPPSYPPGQHAPPPHAHGRPGGLRPPPTQEYQGSVPPNAPDAHSRYAEQHGNVASFTRAVSSSFDRSIKSREGDHMIPHHGGDQRHPGAKAPPGPPLGHGYYQEPPSRNLPPMHDSNASVEASDDSSWRQLKQVASVDEAAVQARMGIKTDEHGQTPPEMKQKNPEPSSNSSSLTNSPAEGHDANAGPKYPPPLPTPSKLASLDSLSSVASAQEPIDTVTAKDKVHEDPGGSLPSPGSSTASLDLMKCHSGSSGLLHGFPSGHQRNISGSSFNMSADFNIDNKRSLEDRGDANTAKGAESDEIRRAPSGLSNEFSNRESSHDRPSKRTRHRESAEDVNTRHGKSELKKQASPSKYKASPLSIACSPPHSPGGDKRGHGERHRAHPEAHHRGSYPQDKGYGFATSPGKMGSSYFDKAPSYTYSIDSTPSFPRESGPRSGYPPLPPRPASSSSSTVGVPMHMDSNQADPNNREIGHSLPSWEINAQDSFGGGSTTGAPGLISNFSFSQDYPALASSGSNLGFNGPPGGGGQHKQHHPPQPSQQHGGPPHPRHHPHPPPVAESRNQSFEGGHYHGGFGRSENVDPGYNAGGPRPNVHANYHENYKHTGPFPPHAPSWGTAASGGSGPPPPQQGSTFHGPPPPHHHGGPPPLGNYNQYRNGPPVPQSPQTHHPGGPPPPPHHYPPHLMMRNFSEDSAVRTSPPPGPPGMHNAPHHVFQPPPEFAAPHNPHLNRRPPPAVYIMSSSQGGPHTDPGLMSKRGPAGGVYSWTKDDDARLSDIMKKYKNPRDWEPIAKEHGRGKTAKECHERWIRYLKPGVRKGQWQDHEDAIVVEAVTTSSEQPFTRWSDLAQRLPGRVGKQIRDRWVNHLNPNINHLPFSREDDLLLWEGHKHVGKRWVEISTKYFNSSRSENHIKNRWYSASFKKFISNEFGPDAYNGEKGRKGMKSDDEESDSESVEAV